MGGDITMESKTGGGSADYGGAARVRLYSRPGNDLTYRFSLIVRRWPACAAFRQPI